MWEANWEGAITPMDESTVPQNYTDGTTKVGNAALVHDDILETYGFGEGHPFNPLRLRMTLDLCEAAGLLEGHEFVGSEPADERDLMTVHSLTYIRLVQQAGRGPRGPRRSPRLRYRHRR